MKVKKITALAEIMSPSKCSLKLSVQRFKGICAKMAGLRPDVLRRSEELLNAIKAGKSVSPLDSASDIVEDGKAVRVLTEFLEKEDWATASEQEIDSFIKMVEEAAVC